MLITTEHMLITTEHMLITTEHISELRPRKQNKNREVHPTIYDSTYRYKNPN